MLKAREPSLCDGWFIYVAKATCCARIGSPIDHVNPEMQFFTRINTSVNSNQTEKEAVLENDLLKERIMRW